MNAPRVLRAFETSRRREVLTFKRHAEVAALPPAEAWNDSSQFLRRTPPGDDASSSMDHAQTSRLSTKAWMLLGRVPVVSA